MFDQLWELCEELCEVKWLWEVLWTESCIYLFGTFVCVQLWYWYCCLVKSRLINCEKLIQIWISVCTFQYTQWVWDSGIHWRHIGPWLNWKGPVNALTIWQGPPTVWKADQWKSYCVAFLPFPHSLLPFIPPIPPSLPYSNPHLCAQSMTDELNRESWWWGCSVDKAISSFLLCVILQRIQTHIIDPSCGSLSKWLACVSHCIYCWFIIAYYYWHCTNNVERYIKLNNAQPLPAHPPHPTSPISPPPWTE